jgi:retron-type reverse transcriptase
VIKLDIKNFFPSITEKHVEAVFANLGWLSEPVKKLTRMCCYQGALPQGAPTSPAVSNLVLKNLDGRLSQLAARNYAVYTRYADDITFSLNEDKKSTIRALIKITQLELAEEGFLLNFKQGKIRVLRRHQHQEICGITVNTDKPTLSRKKRRLLRSVKHRLNNDIPATMTGEQLEGWENFKSMVDAEPEKSSVKQSIKQAAS